MNVADEKLNRYLVASLMLHGVLVVVVIFSPSLFPLQGDSNWGSSTGGNGGINATIVGNLSGIPLPSPPVTREDVAANESPGLNRSEPAPVPPPPVNADPVPETRAPVKTTPPAKAARPAPPSKTKSPPSDEPSNAVPYGQGGRPAMSYGPFQTGAGEAGINFGDGAFGEKYGWYVTAITRRISENWLRSLVDDRIQRAPRVYLSFEIRRDGTIANVELKQGSNIPSLDRSAQRAILASNPLPALPGDYRGSSVTVSFYFEYSK